MKWITRKLTFAMILFSVFAWSQPRYGETLCNSSDYSCIKVKKGESWTSLFPNDETRDIIRRINRMNIRLHEGMTIAVPKNIDRLTIYDVSPFPRYIESKGE
ncbi:MAG: L,D-transpeptidase, partial [Tatlockia sp.]|nr:L,D-transpeptidase [Tatlockia sp.]